MPQLTGTRILNALVSFFSPVDATDQAMVEAVYGSVRALADVTDGGTAGTAQTATTFFNNDTTAPLFVRTATLTTPVAVTANASNNLTITLDRVDAAGLNPVTIGTYTSDVAGGATVAHLPKALVLSTVAGAIQVPAGWSLRVAVSKAGTGVAFAATTSQAYIQVRAIPAA